MSGSLSKVKASGSAERSCCATYRSLVQLGVTNAFHQRRLLREIEQLRQREAAEVRLLDLTLLCVCHLLPQTWVSLAVCASWCR